MVFASICKRASSVFIFASTSIGQFFLASSEHFTEITDGKQRALKKNTDGGQQALRLLRATS